MGDTRSFDYAQVAVPQSGRVQGLRVQRLVFAVYRYATGFVIFGRAARWSYGQWRRVGSKF